MAAGSVISSLKETIYELIDNNGRYRVIPIGKLSNRKLGDDRLKLFKDIISLFRDSDFLSDATKMYIFNRDITMSTVHDELNIIRGNKGERIISKHTVQSKVDYDKKKIVKHFGESFISDILLTNRNIDQYRKAYIQVIGKYYGNLCFRSSLCISLNPNIIEDNLEDSEFNRFIRTIAPYTKSQMDYVQGSLGDREVGYFNYLLSLREPLEGKEKERLDIIKQMLV